MSPIHAIQNLFTKIFRLLRLWHIPDIPNISDVWRDRNPPHLSPAHLANPLADRIRINDIDCDRNSSRNRLVFANNKGGIDTLIVFCAALGGLIDHNSIGGVVISFQPRRAITTDWQSVNIAINLRSFTRL